MNEGFKVKNIKNQQLGEEKGTFHVAQTEVDVVVCSARRKREAVGIVSGLTEDTLRDMEWITEFAKYF